ncbi:titin-like isoform X6 [Megalobrama amblycephala]|uniref:titin-like isoform X6 n=1 Tax=Megalobrama amblycephala TaxID=75352 RepID=UPI002014560B|nr:titin-like isoform X6 [Megalobrama amblycephala]
MTYTETTKLNISEPPQPKLSIESEWKTFYPNENVTLKCSIDGGPKEWGYAWFRNRSQLSDVKNISISGDTLSISSAKASHSGQYNCRGKHLTRTPVTTRQTEPLQLQIYDNTPKPDITKHLWFEFFYTGEKVQLGCNMPGDGWNYDWYKDSKPLNTEPPFPISSASLSDAGVYYCKAKRGDFSVDSETLRVQVQEPPQPKLSIESEWKTFYPTEKVTLKCSIDGGSNEWGYEWFRNSALISVDKDISFSGDTLSISSAKEIHSGQYTCRGKHLNRTTVTTRQAEALKLQIYDKTQKTDITKHRWFEFFYTGEKVQLGCNMPGVGWNYDWYKDSKPLNTEPPFPISSASLSDAGVYYCKAKRGDFSVDSETLRVQVQEPPEPKLSIESEWKTFYPTEKVTLKCSIDEDINEWGYELFKNGAQLSGYEDISFSGDTLSISSAKASHSGQYTCRGKHLKRTTVTTRQTEALKLHIYDNTPKPDITKHQWFEFFYTEEEVQLGCNMPGDGWEYDWYKDSKTLITNPTFTISSASLSNTGVYHCKAKRGDFSVDSETLQVQVKHPPQTKLSIESEWKTFYPTEKVTLKCSINGGSNEWGYEWFRNSAQLSVDTDISFSGDTLSISSAKTIHSGQYTCRGKHLKRTPVTTGQAEALQLHIYGDTPKPDIRKDVWFEPFYTEEEVQLGCNMTGDGWKYDWYKDSETLITDPTFTISSASLSNTGVYHCKAKRGDFSVDSETLQVRVEEPPQPKLSIESEWKTFYPSEKVTLRCSIDGGSNGWGYEWFKNGAQLSVYEDISFSGNTLSISSAKLSHSGQYTCRGKHMKRTPVTTGQAEALQLDIYDNTPKPDIIKHLWFEFFYTEEEVQLGCNMPGDGWKYDWYKDSKPQITNTTFTISSASLSDAGVYQCKSKRGDFSVDSESLQVQVKYPPQPKLSIESEWKTFYPNEKVTLKCSIDGGSNEWGYEWFRNRAQLSVDKDISFSGDTLSISSAKASDSGQYNCRGKHLTRTPVTTGQTDALQLHIYVDTPKPDIRKDAWFEPFYTEEEVQLGCNMPGDGWKYDWYKDSKPLITDPTFTISSASLSNTGVYHCKAKRGNFSVDSETLQVRVEEPPQPKLSIETPWKTFYPSEKVTLKCSIDGGSNEWGYEWFRNGAQLSVDKDITFSGDTLSIISAKVSNSGQFTCRGKHLKRMPVTTRQGEALQLRIYVDTPKPEIRKDQWFEFFYTEEKVQLGCNMPGDGWKYDWYKDSENLITDPTFTISSASLSNTGVYHCKAKRGDFSVDSETLQVRVKARPPAVLSLETELSDIMSGNILTLRCNVSEGRQWSYTWFENGQNLNGSSHMFKVTATEETIKSEFKCKGIRTKRPLYSALSEGFTANTIILKRKILLAISGFLICCIVSLIIGCLVLRFTCKSEKKETVQEDLFFSMADSNNRITSKNSSYAEQVG